MLAAAGPRIVEREVAAPPPETCAVTDADAKLDEAEIRQWIQDFLFGAALYAAYDLPWEVGNALFVSPLAVDGHCPHCQRAATFHRTHGEMDLMKVQPLMDHHPTWYFELTCTRDAKHEIIFQFRLDNKIVQKIGQYPSLADIANDESLLYRQVLDPADAAELHKAIGLAAQGIGVGSFVYLRRVFERLIANRKFRDVEGWSDIDLVGRSTEETIELLRGHLPSFLVKNRKVYSILSKGLYALEEQECLKAFEFLKHSIFFILDEDKRKREELELRLKVEKAIASFSGEEGGAAEKDQ